MSAYGAISRSSAPQALLPSTIWSVRKDLNASSEFESVPYVTMHHLRLDSAPSGLVEYLSKVFAQEVEDGRTYPQEEKFDQQAFRNYFLAEDLLVGIVGKESAPPQTGGSYGDRNWEDCVVGCYYVKPNYPGRSSHICNGGFIVPPTRRKGGYGSTLAKSYVHYAPKLGYRASVFNLVYVNNEASVRLWERLGFTKAGRIPQAGRLKREDGKGEEYVDAWVVYKSFVEDERT
ncbi:hypothetical protein BT96DRAFT_961431 [Gymnopus androsaceus JB14]|uniref:N-acetyltransferase domain-containing protein n=1 Tax=Gymnopus androsaceus JB14 TaxID=1447944 RepID=A0A6A4IST0_9AGAR|nr:hypothetical protein BT96DRAFT_961431 [Gymnopus androsaceus JB14]